MFRLATTWGSGLKGFSRLERWVTVSNGILSPVSLSATLRLIQKNRFSSWREVLPSLILQGIMDYRILLALIFVISIVKCQDTSNTNATNTNRTVDAQATKPREVTPAPKLTHLCTVCNCTGNIKIKLTPSLICNNTDFNVIKCV